MCVYTPRGAYKRMNCPFMCVAVDLFLLQGNAETAYTARARTCSASPLKLGAKSMCRFVGVGCVCVCVCLHACLCVRTYVSK